MEETVKLINSMGRMIEAVKRLLRAIEKEMKTHKDSPYGRLVPHLRLLSKRLYGSLQREQIANSADVLGCMDVTQTWTPLIKTLASLKTEMPKRPELECLSDKVVAAWARFGKAGEMKIRARLAHGTSHEQITRGQMLSLPLTVTASSEDMGIRLVMIRPNNPVYAIRIDRWEVDSSQLLIVVAEFIM